MGRKTDMSELFDAMRDALQNAGYACEDGCGDCLFVDLNGATYSISAMRCEDEGEDMDGEDGDGCACEAFAAGACAGGVDGKCAYSDADKCDKGGGKTVSRYRVTWNETKMCAKELDATSCADAIERVKAEGCDPDQSTFDTPDDFDAYPIDEGEAE